MPELPEVEVTRLGIAPHLEGRVVEEVIVRNPRLRWPVDPLIQQLVGQTILSVTRRAKYLLVDTEAGVLILHLGMSGSLRVLEPVPEPGKHDHLDLVLDSGAVLRLNDPRRFGAAIWWQLPLDAQPLLNKLGPEPLTAAFNADQLATALKGKTSAIKTALMDNHVVVGVGNIYANEALFAAGIHPKRAAGNLSKARLAKLVEEVKAVLARAIQQGGTTLKDFTQADGKPGYFVQQLNVYGRGGQACVQCGAQLKEIKLGQRATVYCGHCQR
ncbi:bifunctional DNA-formamidopyrimidine glycosylase/DNA-(apurinic or apyrimidinic site) lyase [Ferrimonas balearica]|uniref:bifunctional DNA-formamidopyrimidine glycosylase/DNA-(apurinic or apyrimidinic site) lyase n=1 Tax=Ferrimonas balearica TaxID=44012 RepID=UPI001C5859F1|nr:bifunctional DNA-formamidopyrimidine glycosylase/DNA-(apurinic or apyrimidinic site) lyase [Ferrimonas balearica]MBW3141227.1 bifunctional DNA-formamidopyrimidine glycosylase/DNA-(apurinic or apyrimidinic site) lyase [Ferrimonas balearica]MBW3166086.1 bifunctional DNA-formamidopyrimidine glycosylase/DNA-(apurinic or apyrimidinic site) lyase [Ferrimonas balearica]